MDVLSKDLKSLIHYGANVIASPCNTAHYFYDSLKLIDTDVHILDMIQESVNLLKSLGARSVGIMATRGTIRSRLYQKACRQSGITPHIPNDEIQKLITKMIYKHIKAGKDVDIEDFNKAVYYFERLKCEYIILGCTELSLLRKPLNLDDSYIDPLEVLVYKSIVECGKQPVGFSEAFEFMK